MTGQLTFDRRALEPQSPRELLEAALVWISENPEAWQLLVRYAQDDAIDYGRVRIKRAIEDLRTHQATKYPDRSPIKLPNAYSAAFGRILRAWHAEIADCIPLAGSKLDGCTIPDRPY